ncbi:MAG: dTDP-Rha--alpha-D-GlcNAc-pyrophosphate polyprenol alpha-3-L-rhamnosyltransferase [Flavobacteriales bacterium]|nr:dTDP-Rha--alpha-D-GlcNAc-pyrophosphate polyprenol alpha-3-L-rhamnosyltransferase [Flavobacteriales bacterium]|tara:strand:+ start:4249 stop:5262 length:1014 start_codon:yes stop_codon:yes gene_type:complete
MKRVAVVILNWNGEKLLKEFLPSVVEYIPDYAEIIIADNASNDNSISFLEDNYPHIRIIKNTTNGGFAKGYNDALKQIDHHYIVLLNSDIETPENWIEPVINFMDNHPDVGAAMPKILQYKKKSHFEYAGAGGGFIDRWGYPFCRGRIFNDLEEDFGQYNSNIPIFWASGACMFVRNEVFKELNGFDEFFFAHMEEIDLCWRIQRAGYKVYAIGDSHVYHLGGGTLNKLSPRKTFLNFRNNLLLLTKNDVSRGFWLRLIQKLLLDGIAGVKFLFEGNFNHCIAIIKAHYSFFIHLPRYLKIRKTLHHQLGNNEIKGIYSDSVVRNYFLRKKRVFSEF